MTAALEALEDSGLDLDEVDETRVGSSFSTCGGPTPWMAEQYLKENPGSEPWELKHLSTERKRNQPRFPK